MSNFFKQIFNPDPMPDAVPDYPQPFAKNTSWCAIRADDPIFVIKNLRLRRVCESGWEEGLASAKGFNPKKHRVFVTPCIDGFVLVIGTVHLMPRGIRTSAKPFTELQYFATQSEIGYYSWCKFRGKDLLHAYGFAADKKEITWNEGKITPTETELGFDKFPTTKKQVANADAVFPCEEDVLNIAAAWGVDPRFENRTFEKSTGYICKL